jgi:hypothetical protein
MVNGPWLNFEDLIKFSAGKKVVFWGCFDFFEKTMKMYSFPVEFIVDINQHLHGLKSHHGFDVKDPSVLAHLEPKSDYFIIISSSAFYEIFDVLESYGYKQGEEFAITPVLSNFKVIADIFSHKARLLFSSSDAVRDAEDHGGGLYELDIAEGTFEKKLSGVTRGFAWHEDYCFVVDAAKGLRIVDQDYNERDCYELPRGNVPHGIAIDDEKKLVYITLSILDRIGVFDMVSFKEVDSITLSEKFSRSGGKYYQHHFNDICLDGNSLYISMFSRTGTLQRNWLNGAIVDYDLTERRVLGDIASGLWQPHSIKILNDSLSFLDSMRGNLHVVAHKVETHFNGFIRGLDYDGKYYYVGQSVHRYFDRMKGAANNISVDCGIFIYDPESHANRFVPTPAIRDLNTLALL